MCELRIPHCCCCGIELDDITSILHNTHLILCENEKRYKNCKIKCFLPVYGICLKDKNCLDHYFESGECGSFPKPYYTNSDDLPELKSFIDEIV